MEAGLRALSDPTRRRILAWLQARAHSELLVDEVAVAQGIHRTVAFTHLEVLAEAGLLERGARGGRAGRPARTYCSTGLAAEISQPSRQHRVLATLLAAAVSEAGEAHKTRRSGVRDGRDSSAKDGGNRRGARDLRAGHQRTGPTDRLVRPGG
mgnify:CR=1 FL=1